jgi:superfamily I DNA and RNA helicase
MSYFRDKYDDQNKRIDIIRRCDFMVESFFYSQVEKNNYNNILLELFEKYSLDHLKQIYIIDKPLSEKKYNYSYDNALVILIPMHKIIFVNIKLTDDEFDDYCDDFIEDIGYISDKYGYRNILGRPKMWKNEYVDRVKLSEIIELKIEDFLATRKLETKEKERNGELIISLITGSINDVSRIGGELPTYPLDKIKKKIILFDGDQTRFIYQEPTKKRIIIQGLAGTGKTELLLHKLKELYLNDDDLRIAFTCHNEILAQSLRKRIPDFFNFMKVEEQIKWNEKLWTLRGWGSKNDSNSGLYRLICKIYEIPFFTFSYTMDFEKVCSYALKELQSLSDFQPYFDYILIDESQDFPESFFELCSKVTKRNIYIAGDIFQNIFENELISEVAPDFLLNKCYRTDPRTLMFAHGVGMGLFEQPPLRWLKDNEWEACGYIVDKKEAMYYLSRHPLRRFEDLGGVDSIKLIDADFNEYDNEIIRIIEEIIDTNPTVLPDDIGIVFLENIPANYDLAARLQTKIKQRFDWDVNLGYESKSNIKDKIFISNRNNVKGLEFPFMICITRGNLTDDFQNRNSIYMMLTRSFITSYFILSKNNGEIIKKFKNGIECINNKNALIVREPSNEEKLRLRNTIINNARKLKSQFDITEDIMDNFRISKKFREKLHKLVEVMFKENFDEDNVREFIKSNYHMMSGKDV